MGYGTSKVRMEGRRNDQALHVEYAERGKEYKILFISSLFCEDILLAYIRIHVIH